MKTLVVLGTNAVLRTRIREALAEVEREDTPDEAVMGIRISLESEERTGLGAGEIAEEDNFSKILELIREMRPRARNILFLEEDETFVEIFNKTSVQFVNPMFGLDREIDKRHWVALNSTPHRPPRKLRNGRSK